MHSGDQARAAVAEAAACFNTFNLDLMYALPGQSLADLQSDIQTALSFNPPSVSVSPHARTQYDVRDAPPQDLPDDDTAFDMLDYLTEQTTQAGLQRYEVSAMPGQVRACTT